MRFNLIQGHEKIMDGLAKEAAAIYEARTKEVLDQLENDVQKIIYLDWKNGGSLYDGVDKKTQKYKRAKRYEHVSNKDWDNVYGFIMETISMGMG